MADTALTIIERMDIQTAGETINQIINFQKMVHQKLLPKVDYAVIPGTGEKPTLLQPGAQKIAMLMRLTTEYEIVEQKKDYQTGFCEYVVKCSLKSNGNTVAQAIGACNTGESRYAWRWVGDKQVPAGLDKASLPKKEFDGQYGKYFKYRIDNEDIFTMWNTVVKMAQKRALVAATISVAGLSELFTQDVEDFKRTTPPPEQQRKPSQALNAEKNDYYPGDEIPWDDIDPETGEVLPPAQSAQGAAKFKCSVCGKEISKSINDFSLNPKQWGRPLCMDCQQKTPKAKA